MIIDKDFMFSNEQAVTGTSASLSAVDLGAAGDAVGQELTFHVVVKTTFVGLTSLSVRVQTSADASVWDDVVSGPAIACASLTAGKDIFCVRLPQGMKRYVRLHYLVVGTATAGKLVAFASKDL